MLEGFLLLSYIVGDSWGIAPIGSDFSHPTWSDIEIIEILEKE
jgi:hypothetical protein